MMDRRWNGWKRTVREQREFNAWIRSLRVESERRRNEPVSQETEPIEDFTDDEREIPGILTFTEFGQQAPCKTLADSVGIYGIRRASDGAVEFGVGKDPSLEILAWVRVKDFYGYWPK